jgi:hypothetical protein
VSVAFGSEVSEDVSDLLYVAVEEPQLVHSVFAGMDAKWSQ